MLQAQGRALEANTKQLDMLSKHISRKNHPARRKPKAKEGAEDDAHSSSSSSSSSSEEEMDEATAASNRAAAAAAVGRRSSAAGGKVPLGSGLQRASSNVHDRTRTNSMLIRHQQTHSVLNAIDRQTTTSQVFIQHTWRV